MKLRELTLGPILGSRTHAESGYEQMLLLRGNPSAGEQKVYLRVTSEDGSYDKSALSRVVEGRDFTGLFKFANLPENTTFHYVCGVVGSDETVTTMKKKELSGGTRGSFRTTTPGDSVTRFSFGSCRHGDVRKQKNGKHLDDLCFDVMLRKCQDDDFVLMCGDQIYGDQGVGGGDFPRSAKKLRFLHYLKHYRRYFARPFIAQVMSSRPTYMMMDDHEVKDNWSRGAFNRREKKFEHLYNMTEGLYAYDIYQASHAPIAKQGKKKYYYQFSQGRCDFFVMDTRSERDVVPGRIMHPDQMNAVRQFLTAGEDRIKFLVSASPMFPDSSGEGLPIDFDPKDRWEGYPQERGVLLEAMRSAIKKGINRNFIILSGDVHCSFLYRLQHTSDDNFKIHEIVSSAFHWRHLGLNDTHFATTSPLKGNEDFLPVRLPAGSKGTAITDDNFCRVVVHQKIVEATFYNRRGSVVRQCRIPLL